MAKAKTPHKHKVKPVKNSSLHSSGDIFQTSFKAKPVVITAIIGVMVAIGIFAVYRTFAAGESMTLLPATSNVSLGSSFTVTIRENSGTQAVNAVESDLTYDSTKLQFVSISSAGSGFSQGATANGSTPGKIQIARFSANGTTAASVTGDQLVATVTFTAIGTGSTNVGITSCTTATGCAPNTSQVDRASDNQNVLTVGTGATLTIADTTAPNTPTVPIVGTRTVNSIAFSWTAPTDNVGVTGYKVFRNGTAINNNVTGTSFTDTGLTPNTNYSYTVLAFDAAGNQSLQSPALATSTLPDTTPPPVPGGLTIGTKTVTSIAMSWSASIDNVLTTGYNIYRNGVKVGTSASTSYTDTGLTPNTSYSYAVTAFDAVPNESAKTTAVAASTLADTTAPSIPTGLISSAQTTNSISISWTASTDDSGVVASYKVFRNGVQVGNPTTNSFTDTGLSQGTSYSYTVLALDPTGNPSAQSAASSFSTKSKPGDVNSDGAVNATDLSILAAHYGQSGQTLATGDLNGDGSVSVVDLSILATYWGT